MDNWSLQLFVRNILNDYSVTYPAYGSLPFTGRPLPHAFGAHAVARKPWGATLDAGSRRS